MPWGFWPPPEERREPHPVPSAVGVQKAIVIAIKREKRQLPLCLQPPWGCSFAFPPWRSWRLIFPHGAGVERIQSTHSIAVLP